MEWIDVSSNNGPLTTAMMTGCDGVFVKATQGTRYVNPLKQQQANAANLANKIIGNYHWAEPFANTPQAEVRWFINHLEGKPTILAVDVEDAKIQGDVSNWVIEFCDQVEDATGIPVLVYSFAPFIRQHLQDKRLINLPLWLAAYQSKPPIPPLPWTGYSLWQYQGTPLDRSRVILPLPNHPQPNPPPDPIPSLGDRVLHVAYSPEDTTNARWLTDGLTRRWIQTEDDRQFWIARVPSKQEEPWPIARLAAVVTIGPSPG